MPSSHSPNTINVKLASAGLRLLLLIPLALAVLGGWFSVRWLLGSTISEAASTGETPNLDLTRLGVRWAPSDPFGHWRLGILAGRDFSANNLEQTSRDFESAVRLSPNDFRFWDELGRALEAAGQAEAAEKALRRSSELAPNYSFPRWHYGNLLLREGKLDEAFANLFRAAQANVTLWPQVLNLLWQVYDGDVDRIANEACKEPGVRMIFAVYLVGAKKYDDAVRLWSTLGAAERKELIPAGRELRRVLFEAKQFHAALEITKSIDEGLSNVPLPEQFSNGGFEDPIAIPVTQSFGWTIGTGAQAQISINGSAHTGQHSLRIVFAAPNKLDRVNAAQTIVVQPNTQYHFECWARTETLTSASPPVILVFDAADGSQLAASAPLPTGTSDWQKISVDFTTKNNDGITVLIGRLPCTVSDICPLFGTAWYDDFTIQRGAGAR